MLGVRFGYAFGLGPLASLRVTMVLCLAGCAGGGGGAREPAAEPPSLAGTKWRLQDLGGTPAAQGIEATLELDDSAHASGNASCNTFRGAATIGGDSIAFGPLATARKMCDEAVMTRETAYLRALGEARRDEVKDSTLYLHGPGGGAPLRFVRR